MMKFEDPDAWQHEAWKHHGDLPAESAIEVTARYLRGEAPEFVESLRGEGGWWVLFPDWMYEYRDGIKARWHTLHGHPLGDLRGFYFEDRWPNIGQRFTYDPATGEWDR